jgi:stage II sporulation protein D
MVLRLTFLFLLLFSTALQGQERTMRIGLLRDRTVKQVVVMSAKGACDVWVDGVLKGEIQSNDGLRIEVGQTGLVAKSLALSLTARKKIELVPRTADGGFRLRAPEHKLVERKYPGRLEVTRVNNALQLIDHVGLEVYTAGVVQSEAGKDHHIEYYKLQAVTCRTYALSNSRKHLPEGFQLCDGVHCQVFHGVNRHDSIRMAVEQTQGLVLVDANIKMIHATFHSNCGGETVNAEDLWSKSEPYLRATTDTFCLSSPHSSWSRTLTRKEWLGYLQRRYSLRTSDSATLEAVLNYEPTCRDLYLGNAFPLVPLKHVREDLKLNSTFFSVHTEGDEVRLVGKGFGHGVGLCQEGSMRMARSGRSYMDILHHYFTDVHLVDLGTLDFFRD